MSTDNTTKLQALIDRYNAGDDSARSELIGLAHERLYKLAYRILHADFRRFRKTHETGSVLHPAEMRLLKMLETGKGLRFKTVNEFFKLAAQQIRRVLQEMARKQSRREELATFLGGQAGQLQSQDAPQFDPADSSLDPARLALWSEFHVKVKELPERLRGVFHQIYYNELTQNEVAELLSMHPRQVSRRYEEARERLADWLKERRP